MSSSPNCEFPLFRSTFLGASAWNQAPQPTSRGAAAMQSKGRSGGTADTLPSPGFLARPNLRSLDLKSIPRDDGPPSESQLRRQKFQQFEKQCSEVAEGLFLSGDYVAKTREVLVQHGITHIINCVGFLCQEYFKGQFSYKTLFLQDTPSEDILCVLYDVFEYIEEARSAGGKVLIHCSQGVSRSVTLAIAYLMWRCAAPYDEVFARVKAIRGVANPNIGFTCQLLQWAKRRNATPSRVRLYRIAPHCPSAPLYLVPKAVPTPKGYAGPTLSCLDPRGAFVVHTPRRVFVWRGSKCPDAFFATATRIAALLCRYEEAAAPYVVVHQLGLPHPELLAALEAEHVAEGGSSSRERRGSSSLMTELFSHHLQQQQQAAAASGSAAGGMDLDVVQRSGSATFGTSPPSSGAVVQLQLPPHHARPGGATSTAADDGGADPSGAAEAAVTAAAAAAAAAANGGALRSSSSSPPEAPSPMHCDTPNSVCAAAVSDTAVSFGFFRSGGGGGSSREGEPVRVMPRSATTPSATLAVHAAAALADCAGVSPPEELNIVAENSDYSEEYDMYWAAARRAAANSQGSDRPSSSNAAAGASALLPPAGAGAALLAVPSCSAASYGALPLAVVDDALMPALPAVGIGAADGDPAAAAAAALAAVAGSPPGSSSSIHRLKKYRRSESDRSLGRSLQGLPAWPPLGPLQPAPSLGLVVEGRGISMTGAAAAAIAAGMSNGGGAAGGSDGSPDAGAGSGLPPLHPPTAIQDAVVASGLFVSGTGNGSGGRRRGNYAPPGERQPGSQWPSLHASLDDIDLPHMEM